MSSMQSVPVLVGLCGQMGCGKDYLADHYIVPYIEENISTKVMKLSFADQIKVNVVASKKVPFDSVYNTPKTKTVRELLQHQGTQLGRIVHGQDVWINHFDAWCKVFALQSFRYIIVPDVRFENEARYIKNSNGILIKVDAPNRNLTRLDTESKTDRESFMRLKNHVSETSVSTIPDDLFDCVITNDFGHVPDVRGVFALLGEAKVAPQPLLGGWNGA